MLKKCCVLLIFLILIVKSGWGQSDLIFKLQDYYQFKEPVLQLPLASQIENFTTIEGINTGAGNAYAGSRTHATAIYANPAALSALEGAKLHVEIGNRSAFELSNGESPNVFIIPQVVSGAISIGPLPIGFGYFYPYYINNDIDLTIPSDDNSEAIRMDVQRKIHALTFATAYDIGNKLTLGMAIIYLDDTWEAKINEFYILESHVNGFNLTIGSLLRIVKGIDLGLTYQGKSDLLNKENLFDIVQVELKHLLPPRLRFGAGITLPKRWRLHFDAEKVYWAKIPSFFNSHHSRFQYNLGITKEFRNRIFQAGFYTRSHPVSTKLDQKFLTFGFEQRFNKISVSISFQDSHFLTKDREYLSDKFPLKSIQVRYFSLGISYKI